MLSPCQGCIYAIVEIIPGRPASGDQHARERELLRHLLHLPPGRQRDGPSVAAQAGATDVNCYFDEDEFGDTSAGVKRLQRRHIALLHSCLRLVADISREPLCNELLQFAVGNGKRVLTLILDEDIDVEVHPAIAQNPYLFFRASDDLVARLEELRVYLQPIAILNCTLSCSSSPITGVIVAAPPDLLLPPDRLEEARGWLATASARHPKPSPLQVEFVHSSRRQPPRRRPPVARRVALGIALAIAVGAGLLLLGRALGPAQFTGALTSEAQTQSAAEATAASDGALGLIDNVAATSVSLRAAAAHTATTESIMATAAARVR